MTKMCYFNKKIIILIQILCLCSHLYGVKVYHGTTQEESEEDQSEEDVNREEQDDSEEESDRPDYEEEEVDYTKLFPSKKQNKPEPEQTVEPFDLSKFFQDVDAGKYDRKNKFRRDPSQSENIVSNVLPDTNLTFPDFFDATATNTFEEIVEKETDRHVGPAMTQDFDRLVEDIDFDIDMQEHRRRSVRSALIPDQQSNIEVDKIKTSSNITKEKSKSDLKRTNLRNFMRRKEAKLPKNGTDYQPDVIDSISTEPKPKVSDFIITPMSENKTMESDKNKRDPNKKGNHDQLDSEYMTIMEQMKKEMNDKIRKSNIDLMKKLNESNAEIRSKIQKVKKEHNISYPKETNYMNNFDRILNSSDESQNMTMSAGDSSLLPKFVTIRLNKKKSQELNAEALEEPNDQIKELPRKRYASDAYFPEIEDYPSYDTSSDSGPSYDDYESSSPASEENANSKSYPTPSDIHTDSPYNPQNIPPSSSFAHMYRTFDNEQPISTHYSTNHDPNHSSYESNYKAEPETYEPYNKFNQDSPSYGGYGSNYKHKSKNSKPNSMVEVEGDSPDMEYQRVKEPKKDNEDDEKSFDIDKFISDFNTDPPYSTRQDDQSDEGGDEEEEEGEEEGDEGEGEDETDEGETETRPQEYTYRNEGTPKELKYEKTYEKTRSSNSRPKKTMSSPTVQSAFGTNNFKHYFRDDGRGLTTPEKEIPEKINHPISDKKSKPAKKCVKTTKTVPGGKRKMNCKICENLKTGGKSEHCSYLINPNKDNYVVGTEEVTYRTINGARRKRDLSNVLSNFQVITPELSGKMRYHPDKSNEITHKSRMKRQFDYDEDDDEEDEDDKDDNIEAEYGPEYDPYFGEPVGYKSSDGGSCRTVYDDDGSECRVCRNKKTNGEFKECSYASKPQKNAYEYGTSKVYGSGKFPRFRRNKLSRVRRESKENDPSNYSRRKTKKYKNPESSTNKVNQKTTNHVSNSSNSAEVSRLKSKLLEGIVKDENRANEEMSIEDLKLPHGRKSNNVGESQQHILVTDKTPNSNEGGEYNMDLYYKNGEFLKHKNDIGEDFEKEIPREFNFGNGERKRSTFYNDHFSKSFPELLDNGRESLELPPLRNSLSLLSDDSSERLFSNGNGFSNDKFSSPGLFGDDGLKSRVPLDDKSFFKNNKLKLGSRFEDTRADTKELFNDKDSDNLNRMFGDFAAKDRTNCKKRYKDKMTCYACVDENNIRQEECIYIKNSEPETKQVAYHETNKYNNPKAQSSEGRESRIYSSPVHELYEDEEETVPQYERNVKNLLNIESSFEEERPSKELNIEIKKKNPKHSLALIDIGNSDEEMEAIQNMDIQRVSKGKSKPHGKGREQSYSSSSHVENVELPDSPDNGDEAFDGSVSGTGKVLSSKKRTNEEDFRLNNQSNNTMSATHPDPPLDTQVEGSHINENVDIVDDLDEKPEEPKTEGPEGAFSDETETVYDPERKLELPRYMVEKSEGERMFDQVSKM